MRAGSILGGMDGEWCSVLSYRNRHACAPGLGSSAVAVKNVGFF